MNTDSISSKARPFCHTLCDYGVGYYGELPGAAHYLIFLKVADGFARPPHLRKVGVPTATPGRHAFAQSRQAGDRAQEAYRDDRTAHPPSHGRKPFGHSDC